MNREVPLDGDDWELQGFLGGSWRWSTGPGLPAERPAWTAARVPGSIVDDLWRAGKVPDPYFERNSLLLEWVPARTWVYRRRLHLPVLDDADMATLVFEGVDHRASVFVDGHLMGEHEGVFCPFEVDITAAVRPGGAHLLAVVVHAAPDNEPQGGDTARVRAHKSRMGYGWDFCPRLVHLGIWRPVTLHIGARPFRPRPLVRTAADLSQGEVEVEGAEALSLFDGGQLLAHGQGPSLTLAAPHLWWPNGEGAQHRYRLVCERDGQAREATIGFRHLVLVDNPGAPAGARPYTVAVNGRAIFLKGWNWVPADALYGVPRPGRLAHLLGLAAAAGANCLRVWGGGLLETPEFYDLCDALGLLVWQEFSLSSSIEGSEPSDDPGYLAVMAAEAPAVIEQRRHHPSLALWCGGNELARRVPGRDDVPLDESVPVIGLLARAVAEHDPGRPFLPTSPSGPRFLNRLDIIDDEPDGQHDVHGPWEHQGLTLHNQLYDAGTCLLHSEVGVEGMANRRAHGRVIAAAHQWPADRTNEVYEHLGAWWDNAALVQACFGQRLADLPSLRRASQHLQHDGLRYIVESRLRRRPRTSGVFPWQFNEPYPNAWCTAVVDHLGEPKPAYYGVRRAYRDVHVCASFPVWAWAGREQAEVAVYVWPAPATVEARFVDAQGGTVGAVGNADGPSPAVVGHRMAPVLRLATALAEIRTEVFLLDLVAHWPDGRSASNRYVLSTTSDLAPLLELDQAQVHAGYDGEGLLLAHIGGPAAIGVVIEDARQPGAAGWAVLGDNFVNLLPGEERRVTVEWRGAAHGTRSLSVAGWNVPSVVLDDPRL